MEYNIVRLKLNRGADLVRFDFEQSANLSTPIRFDKGEIVDWWKHTSEKFRNEVFKPRSRDFDIEVVAFLIAKLSDVIIYSSNYDRDTKRFRSMYVISNKNVVKITELKIHGTIDYQVAKTEKSVVEPTKPILVTWVDAISNHTSGTAEEIMERSKITPIKFAGFLIGTTNKALYIATAYNKEINKYRGVLIIPLMNVESVECLV